MSRQFLEFRVCQSVHHHTFNRINQQDAATYQVYYMSFKYSSTCFGHPHAYQELNNCSRSLWFYRRSVVIAVLLVVLSQTSDGKSEAAAAVLGPDDGHEDSRNMLSCS
jgi:hypothetical protein